MLFIPVNLWGQKGWAEDGNHSGRQKIPAAFTLTEVSGPFHWEGNGQTGLLEVFGILEPSVKLAICMVLDRLYHIPKPISSSEN